MTFRYRDHIGWITSKLLSRLNRLRDMLRLTPIWAIWCNGNTPKIRGEFGWGQKHKKFAISPKRCKIGPRLFRRSNRKLHKHFRLASESMTLDALDRPKRHSGKNESFFGANQENVNEDWHKLSVAKCRSMILVSRYIRFVRIFTGVP